MKNKNKRRIKLMEYNINELREDLAEIDAELRELNTRMNRLENNLAGAAAPTTPEPAQVEVSFGEPTGALSGEAKEPNPQKSAIVPDVLGIAIPEFAMLPPGLRGALSHLVNTILVHRGVVLVKAEFDPVPSLGRSFYESWKESKLFELTFILLWLWSKSAWKTPEPRYWFNVHAVDDAQFILELVPMLIGEGVESPRTPPPYEGDSTVYLPNLFYIMEYPGSSELEDHDSESDTKALLRALYSAMRSLLHNTESTEDGSLANENSSTINKVLDTMFEPGFPPKWFFEVLAKYKIVSKALNEKCQAE